MKIETKSKSLDECVFEKLILKTIYNLKIPSEYYTHFSPVKKKFQINLSTFSNEERKKILELLNENSQLSSWSEEITGFKLIRENNRENKDIFAIYMDSSKSLKDESKIKFNYERMEFSAAFYHSLINSQELTVENVTQPKLQSFYLKVSTAQKEQTRQLGLKILTEFLEYQPHEIPESLSYRIGKTKYFFSYNQSLLEHLLEVSVLSANFASQLNLSVVKAKRAAFFHDIGKISGQYSNHVSTGVALAQQFKLDPYIIETIQFHHNYEVKGETPYLPIVRAMDKISAGRLGARPMQMEKTKERNEKIHSLLSSICEISKVEFLAGGHIIKLSLDPQNFKWESLSDLKQRISLVVKSAELNYQYNYQFLFKLEFQDSFMLEDY